MSHAFSHIAIIGCGIMGRGIAQMAAQAGCQVWLHDGQPQAAHSARQTLANTWAMLQQKGKQSAQEGADCLARIHVAASLHDVAHCDLVIEAIAERMEAKQALLAALEAQVAPHAVLATNTSSLSVTALAAGLGHPERLAGFHFFNPVPLMKVVEVIGGLQTDPAVCQRLSELARAMGHTPVQAKDTPGFIVNHAGRGYGTEALRIASEGVADFATIDAVLRDQVGFRLGPFELFDLTGMDVSHPVTESIYRQYYDEPRYRPSALAAQRVAAGWLGKKTGRGFYAYADGQALRTPEAVPPVVAQLPPVWVSPRATRRADLLGLLKTLGADIETGASPSPQALTLVAPLGFDITTVSVVDRHDPARTLGIDMLMPDAHTRRRVLATNPATRADMRHAAHALFARDGKAVSVIRDSAGFITQRVVASLVNIASDMCQQGVCTPTDLDTAVQLGLGYPAGPLALGNQLGPDALLEVLFNMQTVYGDPRYRPSPWLRRRGAIGLSLLHTEDH